MQASKSGTGKTTYDTIIVGAGIMGSSTARELAFRGQRVLLMDQFTPPHDCGSSHGETRVIREAYFEDPIYVPMVQRAYTLWRELEQRTGSQLLTITGGLMLGPANGIVFGGARRSAEQHGIPHEILDARAVNDRFPALNAPEEFSAVFEPRAGMLYAESCLKAFLTEAGSQGAEFRWNTTATQWQANDSQVEVDLGGEIVAAETLVLAAGPWMPEFIHGDLLDLTVERQVLHWFNPCHHSQKLDPKNLPVHVWEYEPGKFFYALPDAGSGVKTALHHQGQITTANDVSREVTETEALEMQRLVERHLPLLDRAPHQSTVCLYTNTSDGHFVVDRHPKHPNVIILSPCSGHGFKFAPVVGEIAADLVMDREVQFDTSVFRLRR